MYKISQFNHFQPWLNGHHMAFNSRTGALGLMDEDNLKLRDLIFEKIRSGSDPKFSPEEAHLVQQLEYGKFIYADHYDEVEELKFQHNLARYDRNSLGLALAPTMACNMACEYCYEENKKGIMKPEVVEAILDFVEARAIGMNSLNVNWYGGEPLLAMDIIEDLSESFLDLAEEFKFRYNASMVTNGYLLDKEKVDKLADKFKVDTIQITIDGPSDEHNRKRPLKNGRESFETIAKNAHYAAQKMRVNIRVNIDKSFSDDMIRRLLGELDEAGLRDRIGLYFGRIEASTTACANISENCYSAADFSKVETDFYRLLLQTGFAITHLPRPMATACFAHLVYSFLIDPEGDIYKCYNFVGDKTMAMGNIKKDIDFNHPNFTAMFNFSPFQDKTCTECSVLPICMGGCPDRRRKGELVSGEACETWKHNLGPMLEIIALSRQNQAQSSAKETT
jgi:uncharacterized protein